MEITTSDYIASAALIISAYSAWNTYDFNKKQKPILEQQKLLNEIQMQKNLDEEKLNKAAFMNATIVSMGNSKYKLRIFNEGRAAAKNVKIFVPLQNELYIDDYELKSKFPIEELPAKESLNLTIMRHNNSKHRYQVDLLWEDELSRENKRTVQVTF